MDLVQVLCLKMLYLKTSRPQDALPQDFKTSRCSTSRPQDLKILYPKMLYLKVPSNTSEFCTSLDMAMQP